MPIFGFKTFWKGIEEGDIVTLCPGSGELYRYRGNTCLTTYVMGLRETEERPIPDLKKEDRGYLHPPGWAITEHLNSLLLLVGLQLHIKDVLSMGEERLERVKQALEQNSLLGYLDNEIKRVGWVQFDVQRIT